MARIDLQLDNNDIVISNNDLQLVESDSQHIVDTLNACPGWWKENYTDGVEILKYLKAKNFQELEKNIKLQLQSDGYNANPSVSFDTNGNLIIDANVTI